MKKTFATFPPDQMDVFYFACFGRFNEVKWKQNLILSKRHEIVSLKLACSAGVFFERAICSRKRNVETSRREEEMA